MSAHAHISGTLDRLERWLREHQPAFLDAMRPGATDAELDDLERAIGRTLPEDVRAFYRWRAGTGPRTYPRERSPFWDRPLTLNEIRDLYQEWSHRAETFWREPDYGPGWWHPAWVPFMGDEDDGCYCVDTAGTWTAIRGQIIAFQVSSVSRRIVAGSLCDWLRVLVADLEHGKGYDSDGHRIDTLTRYPLGYTQLHDAWEAAVVPENEVEIESWPAVPNPDVGTPGDRVRLTAGSFAGQEGTVLPFEPGAWTTRVQVVLWGRPVDIEVDPDTLVLLERSQTPPATLDWNSCNDAGRLLSELRVRGRSRKLRLLSAACYRVLLESIPDAGPFLGAIENVIETGSEVSSLRALANDFWCEVDLPTGAPEGFYQAIRALTRLRSASDRTPEALAPTMVRWGFGSPDLIREIFPNPFSPPRFDPAWRTSDVFALARGIYDDRTFDGLPVLADALQDAGCDNDELLNHLRDTSRAHVRGCWALDLCLGLE